VKHSRSRNVPHPTGARVRDLTTETNGRRDRRIAGTAGSWPAEPKRIGGKDLFAPKRPALCFIYEDLAEHDDLVPQPVFGMYPRSFIPKILPWLKCARRNVVHVCSGGLPRGEGIRVDVRPEARPDVLADGRALPFADGSVEAVLLDPPYTEHYAKDLYGVDYPRPSHLLREAARVVRPCGRIGFVHYITPNPPPGCRVVKVFGLSTGFGFPMRAVTIYEREQHALPAASPTTESTDQGVDRE
jgi:hypothetical protein